MTVHISTHRLKTQKWEEKSSRILFVLSNDEKNAFCALLHFIAFGCFNCNFSLGFSVQFFFMHFTNNWEMTIRRVVENLNALFVFSKKGLKRSTDFHCHIFSFPFRSFQIQNVNCLHFLNSMKFAMIYGISFASVFFEKNLCNFSFDAFSLSFHKM